MYVANINFRLYVNSKYLLTISNFKILTHDTLNIYSYKSICNDLVLLAGT